MDLGLEVVRSGGKPERTPVVLDSRPLTREEVEARAARVRGVGVEPLRRLNSRHRELARRIAQGSAPGEAALAVGLTPARVGQLLNDATFRDLVAHYEANRDTLFEDFQKIAAIVGEETMRVLLDRLEGDPEGFENGEIITLAKTLADRTGHAPKREHSHSVTFNIGDRLEAARKRAREIDITPEPAE